MKRRLAWIVGVGTPLLLLAGGALWWFDNELARFATDHVNELLDVGGTETVDITEYHAPLSSSDDRLHDDRLEDKHTHFNPALVDSRPVGGWQVNLSDSVLKLDVPLVKPDEEPNLLVLHPSYAAAAAAAKAPVHEPILPSVNMIDGKAKQFDDGLYAALDQAYFQGNLPPLLGHVELVGRLYRRVGPESHAAPYLAACLELAGQKKMDAKSETDRQRWSRPFLSNELASKPIGFYTWTPTLSDCFRFVRFLQQPFSDKDRPVVDDLVQALAADESLRADYRKAVAFYAQLTNPPHNGTLIDAMSKDAQRSHRRPISFFPSSTSPEGELFTRLFPRGFPPGIDLMRELVRRIRSGEVDLAPKAESGWYDYQIYALETLLVPELGEEHQHLLLTKAYKKRMLEAFKALVTKRRETHARLLGAVKSAAPPLEESVRPRLRVEPCPSYYLRTARAYTFLSHFLDSALGSHALKSLHGLREGKPQSLDLQSELDSQRALFYGLYLLSAEDIGLNPALHDGEILDRDDCRRAASEWLTKVLDDPDLARDTRVAIPIAHDVPRDMTRVWATLGVRLTRLNTSYARPPRIRPVEGEAEWRAVPGRLLLDSHYVIAVDEFAEIEMKGARALNRDELRALCDRWKTKEAIVAAISK